MSELRVTLWPADQSEWLCSLLCSVPMKTAELWRLCKAVSDPRDKASCMYISAGLGFLWRARPLTSWLRTARLDLSDAKKMFFFVWWQMIREWAVCRHKQHLHVYVWELCALLWVKQAAWVEVFLHRLNLWCLVNGIVWHYFLCHPIKNLITFNYCHPCLSDVIDRIGEPWRSFSCSLLLVWTTWMILPIL